MVVVLNAALKSLPAVQLPHQHQHQLVALRPQHHLAVMVAAGEFLVEACLAVAAAYLEATVAVDATAAAVGATTAVVVAYLVVVEVEVCLAVAVVD